MSVRLRFTRFTALPLALLVILITVEPGSATSFGSLDNFDVVNDTSQPCHGFEIELEDIRIADVPYTFGGTYLRYGTPEVIDATVDPAHPLVLVRYRHWTGSSWEATPVALPNLTPAGHDCFANGPVGNYLESGCEHFGVSLSASPTRTSYRWIVAADPSDINTSFSAVPQQVALPVPVWDVAPIPVAAGGGVNIRAEVEPVEEENHAQHGEPQWMKAFKIESDLDLQPEDLVKLLLGVAGGILPGETEIETEWKLIQSKPGDAEGEEEDAEVKEDPLDDDKHSVIRRYEFYRYVGPRDAENNEALPCIDEDQPVPAEAPVEDCSDLGSFIGAQNVAVDVDLTVTDTELPAAEIGVPYPAIALLLGGLAPYTIAVSAGSLPPGLVLDLGTGILSGTPTIGGDFEFTISAEDAATDNARGTFHVVVSGAVTPTPTDELPPTATATPSETPIATATIFPTQSPTPAPTETPTIPTAICVGDCNRGNSVTVDELITLVNIALGTVDRDACSGGVAPGTNIDVVIIIQAVVHALEGCRSS